MSIAELINKIDGKGDLREQQELLETISQGLGIDQYRKTTQKAKEGGRESNTSYGSHLLSFGVTSVSEGITSFIKKAYTGKAGRRHMSVKYLEKVNPEVAAYFTLRACLDGISSKHTIQKVALEIANYVEDEVKFGKYKEEEGLHFKYSMEKAKKATTYRHKRNTLTTRMAKVGVENITWPKVDKLNLGVTLINILIEATGYVSYHNENYAKFGKPPKIRKVLKASPETQKWIQDKNSRCELLSPKYLPCVIPPKEWTTPYDGGYHSESVRSLTFIKTSHKNFMEEVCNARESMPMMYKTVNGLQNTPWKINQKVLDTMKYVWDNEIDTQALVARKDISEIPCPSCGEFVPMSRRDDRTTAKRHNCFDTDETSFREWKVSAAKAHEANAKLISKRIQVQTVVWIADLMSNFEEIYMPYQLDFRGRVYATPFYLNPQGADYSKGLLTLGEGKPLGDNIAAGWLAIHGANVYGYDKVSLADRITFIGEMNDKIQAVAQDPIENMSVWMDADKPWQFLAFCYEWDGYLREGVDWVSHLPIALDGSCSGIQHFSAMLRDEKGAEAVNLLYSETPNDIYQMVCDKVKDKLKDTLEDNPTHPYAQGWLNLNPDRKLTKRQVMTLPYGSTKFSCREYTSEYVADMVADKTFNDSTFRLPWADKERRAAEVYASDLIWDAIGDTVVAARSVMGWLRDTAKVTSKYNLPIIWTTPAGFPVFQYYPDYTSKRVKSQIGEGTIQMTIKDGVKDTLNKNRMVNGISPNFVHSMDACHLAFSVNYALEDGIKDFAMIHDSFGTHACNTEHFSSIIRESFVDMYEQFDVLQMFKDSVSEMLTEDDLKKLPKDLPKGDLNLAAVKASSFFFA